MELVKRGFGTAKITQDDLAVSASDIFSIPTYDDNFTEYDEINFQADGIADENGPYKFTIASNDQQYIALKDTVCVMKLLLVNRDNEPLHTAEDVAFFLPNIASAIFESVKCDIQGRPAPDLTQDEYGYKSYIEHLLSFSEHAVGDVLYPRLMLADAPGLWENPDANLRYAKKGRYELPADRQVAAQEEVRVNGVVTQEARAAVTHEEVDERNKFMRSNIWQRWVYATSQPSHTGFTITTPLAIDWFGADRLLPPKTSLSLTFRKKPKEFYLLIPGNRPGGQEAANGVKLKIIEFRLKVAYQTLAPQLRAEHEAKFNKGMSCVIPYQNITLKRRAFAKDLTELAFDYCISGDIPKQMLIVLVSSKAYDGDLGLSPFRFHHYDMESCSLRINNRMMPNEPIKCNFADLDYSEQFAYFYKNVGLDALESSSMISYPAYLRDYTMIAFDLAPDKCNGHHLHRLRNGTVDVKMNLRTKLPEPVTMLVLCTYDKMLKLNKFREAEVVTI